MAGTLISQCLCDLTFNQCDVNCCCDGDCTGDDVQLFSECWTPPEEKFSRKYCFSSRSGGIGAWNNSGLRAEEQRGGLFCIARDNVPKLTFYQSRGPISSEEMIQRFLPPEGIKWGTVVESPDAHHSGTHDSGMQDNFYKFGSPVFVIDGDGVPGVLSQCSIISK